MKQCGVCWQWSEASWPCPKHHSGSNQLWRYQNLKNNFIRCQFLGVRLGEGCLLSLIILPTWWRCRYDLVYEDHTTWNSKTFFCSVCWGTIRDQHSYWWGESRRKWSVLTLSRARRLRWWTQGAPALCFVTMVDMLVAETPRAKSSWGILTPSLCNIPWILIQVGILPSCASNKSHL